MSTPEKIPFKHRGHTCLNCYVALETADKFCHQCSQINSTKKLALSDFVAEFLSSFISYDSRIWRTISGILFRPGVITREYCRGRRMHYANPFRFFLTVSIVFFLLIQIILNWNGTIDKMNMDQGSSSVFQFNETIAQEEATALALTKTRDSLQKSGDFISSSILTKVLEKRDSTKSKKTTTEKKYITQKELDAKNFLYAYFYQTGEYMDYYSNHKTESVEDALKAMNHRNDLTNQIRYTKAIRFQTISNNPTMALIIVIPKMPLFLFFFAPVISFFLWLIYSKATYNFMEHLIFIFHLFTFNFLAMFLIMGIRAITFGWLDLSILFFLLIGPFYLYKAMRNFYVQGRLKTIIKFVLINFVFFLFFTVSSLLFIAGSVFLSV